MIFQSIYEANMTKICWQIRAQVKDTKISKFGNIFQSWKIKKIWFPIKDSSINAMDFCSSFWPNFILLYICKLTLIKRTWKKLQKDPIQFQEIPRKLKTSFCILGRFKSFYWFQYLAEDPRKVLQSNSDLKTQEITENISHTVCHIFQKLIS